jgi:hypothetical protein
LGNLTQHKADGARGAPRVSGRDLWRMFWSKGMCQAPQLMRIVVPLKAKGLRYDSKSTNQTWKHV